MLVDEMPDGFEDDGDKFEVPTPGARVGYLDLLGFPQSVTFPQRRVGGPKEIVAPDSVGISMMSLVEILVPMTISLNQSETLRDFGLGEHDDESSTSANGHPFSDRQDLDLPRI